MTIRDRILAMEAEGITLRRVGDKLNYRAPMGTLDADSLAFLKTNKLMILNLLDFDRDGPSVPTQKQAFPMTPMQEAFLLGRAKGLFLGGLGCHAYGELTADAALAPRLPKAWQAVVERHPMLRATVSRQGYQTVRPDVPSVLEIENRSEEDFEEAICGVRASLSHRVYGEDDPQLWTIRALSNGKVLTICFSIDFIIADFESISTLMADLEGALHGMDMPALPKLGFADHVLEQVRRRDGLKWARDRAFWLDRRAELADALWRPDSSTEQRLRHAEPRFRRYQHVLHHAAGAGSDESPDGPLGANAVILAAYSEAIGELVRRPDWIVNVTTSLRGARFSGERNTFGNFSTAILLHVRQRGSLSFDAWASQIQNQLLGDIGHMSFCGVELMRALQRDATPGSPVLAPFVFTSMLRNGDMPAQLEPGYSISQTPQVLIDCQIGLNRGNLMLAWDVRDGFLTDREVKARFDTFVATVAAKLSLAAAPVHGPKDIYLSAVEETENVAKAEVAYEDRNAKPALITRLSMGQKQADLGAAEDALVVARKTHFEGSDYGGFLSRLDHYALAEMVDLMRRRDMDVSQPLTTENMIHGLRARPDRARIVARWSAALMRAGWTERRDGKVFLRQDLPKPPEPKDWADLREVAQAEGYEDRSVLDYFRLCALTMGEVLTGDADPVKLFFPNGTTNIAEALFGQSRMNRELHALVGQCAQAMARALHRPIRILELGAGVGATTRSVLQALRDYAAAYTASDNSAFMRDHLKAAFAEDRRVTVAHLDMDHHPLIQGFDLHGYDLVIAGDALHLATDPELSLRQMRSLLADGGAMIAVEMCADRPQVMFSIETLYSVDHQTSDGPFLSRPDWETCFSAAGYPSVGVVEHPDSGQCVFVAPALLNRHIPKTLAIKRLAQQHLGVAPEHHVVLSDAEPVAAILATDFAQDPIGATPPDCTPMSDARFDQIVRLLPDTIEGPVSPASTAQTLQMDSLLCAQFTGRLLDTFSPPGVFFDDVLVLLLEGRTLSAIENVITGAGLERTSSEGGPTAKAESASVQHLVPRVAIIAAKEHAIQAAELRDALAARHTIARLDDNMRSTSFPVDVVVAIGAEAAPGSARYCVELSETGTDTCLVLWTGALHVPVFPDDLFLTVDVHCLAPRVPTRSEEQSLERLTMGRVTWHPVTSAEQVADLVQEFAN
ncbi:MAG: methyltransferase [Paracoccaceae bacterium]|nr:methyltransferase [Paracoccaceae bacterium]